MTVKQIAEAVGKNAATVSRWVSAVSCKMQEVSRKVQEAKETSKPADYDLDETIAIIQHGMGKNAADLYRMSAAQPGNGVCQVGQVDEDRIARIAARAAVAAIREMFPHMAGPAASVPVAPVAMLPNIPPAPAIDARNQITRIVRQYAMDNGIKFPNAWNLLYTEYGYRTHTDPQRAAGNRSISTIDYIESLGQLDVLLSVAMEVMA